MRTRANVTTWLRRLVDVTLATLIVVVLLAVALGKLVPLTGGRSIIIGGSSMEPAIHLGSTVVVFPVEPAELRVGDVVSIKLEESRATFTHRIVAIVDRPDGRWIRTKGDANADPDPTLVPATTVIGRVELSVPLIGYLLVLLSTVLGVLFVVGIGATLLAIAWLLDSMEIDPRAVVASAPARSPNVGSIGLVPAGGSMAAQLVAPGTRTPLTRDPAARPRSTTVREHLQRSRTVRNRRARWLSRHQRDARVG